MAIFDFVMRVIKGSVPLTPVARWAWHLSCMGMTAEELKRLISTAMRLTVEGTSETLKVWRRAVGNKT